MSEQAVMTREGDGITATLHERIREFTSFYEAHAYLAYNLALRIACAGEPAARAVQRGFLRQLDPRADGLVAATVQAALEEAPRVQPDVEAAGDPSQQPLLAAVAALAPAERAALAMEALADSGIEEIGEALGLPSEQSARLLERARGGFAAALGAEESDAQTRLRDWMWAAPPNEIWEELYPLFHQAVERGLRRGAAEQTLVLKPETSHAPAKASRRARRWTRLRPANLRSPPRRLVVLAAFVLAAGALAASQLPRSDTPPAPVGFERSLDAAGGEPVPNEPAVAQPGVKPRKPLTAALLDKLRLRELRQLREYGRRQADTSLPARQRRAASRRVAALERAARRRLRGQQRREQELLDRQARARSRAQAPPPPSDAAPRQTPRRRSPASNPAPAPSDGPPRNQQEAERSCLLDENTGQYVCPAAP